MFTASIAKILACPNCKLELRSENNSLLCPRCKEKFLIIGGIPILLSRLYGDTEITQEKWDKNYTSWGKGKRLANYLSEYRQDYLDDILTPINKLWRVEPQSIYCEIGCGPAIVGLEMAKRGCQVVGIDLSLTGLKLAKKLYEQEKVKGFFVCGDILKMPFKTNSFDFIYGGGVLEHFEDTLGAVRELYRILKNDGRVFATVPFVSLSTLTYRQLYGNIPELPILKKIFEFTHIKILKKRFMPFGYEKSFTKGRLKRLFLTAGFSEVEVNFFDCYLPFYRFKNEHLKNILRKLAKFELFWPMVYIEAVKR